MNRIYRILPATGALLCVSLVFLLNCYHTLSDQALLGLVASIVAIYFGILKQQIESDKLFKELFESFNEKYDISYNDIFNRLRDGAKILSSEDRLKVIDYFNFCAEEYLWYKKGRVPLDVWKAWKRGILYNINIPLIKQLYLKEVASAEVKASYYGLVEELAIKP